MVLLINKGGSIKPHFINGIVSRDWSLKSIFLVNLILRSLSVSSPFLTTSALVAFVFIFSTPVNSPRWPPVASQALDSLHANLSFMHHSVIFVAWSVCHATASSLHCIPKHHAPQASVSGSRSKHQCVCNRGARHEISWTGRPVAA